MVVLGQYPRVAALNGVHGLRARLVELGTPLPSDDVALAAPTSPLAQPLELGSRGGTLFSVANRFVIQPMEGWDAAVDGRPTDLTLRRWRNFGRSGAGWIWGGEAVAVCPAGRGNPHQLLLTDDTAADIGGLRRALLGVATAPKPVTGLQLTHSGRWSQPTAAGRAPRIAFRHPLLDARAGVTGDTAILSDGEVRSLIRDFAHAAYLAQEEGFDFVDIKHCHGYLLHEFLAARSRPGAYGGAPLAPRTHLLGEVITAVRMAAPRIAVGVRLSVFDGLPHHPAFVRADGRLGPGVAEKCPLPYEWGFGVDPNNPDRIDLTEPIAVVRRLRELGVAWLNVTAGSPYYVPHIQRPALFPPSHGYAPPEDPLAGVARLLYAARALKAAVPEMIVVSSGWTYLQEYVPHVAQACVRENWFDVVGLGRMVLAYPEFPADVLAGRRPDRRRICRTFSDCTSAPRNGLASGCYPLDPFYRARPEAAQLQAAKRRRG